MNDVGGKAAYEYDLLGRVTKVTDEEGHVTKYTYGENGQVSGITYADGFVVKYGYDKNDNLTSVTDENGTAKYAYDALGRPVSLVRSDDIKTTYVYDENGNLTELKNTAGDGTVISAFSYEYDALGHIVKEAETGSVGGMVTRTFDYNQSGELVTFGESSDAGKVKYEYSYDKTGNRMSQKKTGAGENETIVYLYDQAGRLASETSSLTGKTSYKYDKDGNLIEKSGADTQTTYEYTVENRLKAVREGGRLLMAASYDGDGNRVLQINLRTKNSSWPNTEDEKSAKKRASEEGMPNADMAITDANTPKGGPDAWQTESNPILRVLSYLKALFMPLMPYTLEELATDPIPGYGAGGVAGWFRETAITSGWSSPDKKRVGAMDLKTDEERAIQNARIPAVYTGYRYEDTYELTRYVNDTNRENTEVLMEYMGNGNLKTKYTYGHGLLSTSNAAASGARGETGAASYISDGRGSVSALISQVTGGLLAAYAYDPYGTTTATAYGKSGATAPYTIEEAFYGYNSESYDPLTSLQYLRARYYDPQAGRFGVADTNLGQLLDPLTRNLYAYAGNDPVNKADPSGHAWSQAEAVYQSIIYLVQIPYGGTSMIKTAVSFVEKGRTDLAKAYYQAIVTLVGYYTYQWGCRVRLNADGSGGYPKVGSNPKAGAAPMPPSAVPDPMANAIDVLRNPQRYSKAQVAAAQKYVDEWTAKISGNANKQYCSDDTGNIPGNSSSDSIQDVTVPVTSAVMREEAEFHSHFGDMAWFYNKVKSGAEWDIKLKDKWNNKINTPFPGVGVEVLFRGARKTPEAIGNMTYGYLGTATGFSVNVLLAGGDYAAGGISGIFRLADSPEDKNNIKQGVTWYDSMH